MFKNRWDIPILGFMKMFFINVEFCLRFQTFRTRGRCVVDACNYLVDMLLSNLLWVSTRPYFTGITFTFSSTTNTTQILQTRKQMEHDNNEH